MSVVEISLQTAGQVLLFLPIIPLNQFLIVPTVRLVLEAAERASLAMLKASTVPVAAKAVMKKGEIYIMDKIMDKMWNMVLQRNKRLVGLKCIVKSE